MTSSVSWKIVSESVRGADHGKDHLPCQDAHASSVLGDGFLVAVVSDGAGSATQALFGATAITSYLTKWLTRWRQLLKVSDIASIPSVEIQKVIERGIIKVRGKLLIKSQCIHGTISDFHATLVGAIADQSGGWLFHIGDGAVLAFECRDSKNYILSSPENGEYSNETYFFTQDDWKEHLRLTWFGPECDTLMLMSDGVTPAALAKGASAPFDSFINPVTKFLSENDVITGKRALVELLERPAMQAISGDDKTLVWARRMSDA